MSRAGNNIDKLPEAIDERCVGWVGNKQKLICLMTLGDGIGVALSRADSPFFRAFIVEDRTTHRISANMRFRYHDRVCWYRIKLKEDEQQKNSAARRSRISRRALSRCLPNLSRTLLTEQLHQRAGSPVIIRPMKKAIGRRPPTSCLSQEIQISRQYQAGRTSSSHPRRIQNAGRH